MNLMILLEISAGAIVLYALYLIYTYGILIKQTLVLRNNDKTISIMYHELHNLYMTDAKIIKLVKKMDNKDGKFSKYLYVINTLINTSIKAEQALYPKMVKEGFIKPNDLEKTTLEDVIKKIDDMPKEE